MTMLDRRRFSLAALAAVGALGTAACSSDAGGGSAAAASDAGGADAGAVPSFPLTVDNCEAELRFDSPPQRIMLLESAPVTTLDGIGALDLVVGRAGAFPSAYYSEDLAERIGQIPSLSEDIDASGHLQISQELVIAQQPDLVMGLPDGITREGMRSAGAEVLVQNVYCAGSEPASWDQLDAEVRTVAEVLGRADAGEELIGALHERIDAVSAAVGEDPPAARTAAVLYPSVGGGPLYAYGAASMASAQLGALGLRNVFESTPERVFELSAEPLLDADPDVLIVLHQDGDGGAEVTEELESSPATAGLAAVSSQAVLPLLFNFCEPASPLVVDGLEQIHDWLAASPGADA